MKAPKTVSGGLQFRNSLQQWDGVPSKLVFEGEDQTPPSVTIAITTFRRPAFLAEAVASVLAQDTDVPFELIVLDNDPGSKGVDELLQRFPELRRRSFRYFVNAENIGMFGNINRTILLARGKWLSNLHDDDLLRPDFLGLMWSELARFPSADGIVCQQRIMDQRPPIEEPRREDIGRMDRKFVAELALRGPSGWRVIVKRGHGRVVYLATKHQWLWRQSRRIRPKTLFWGPVLGNGGGFLFKTDVAKQIGGFDPDEFPASDLYFYARFAAYYHLRQHREEAAIYRVAENESLKIDTAWKGLCWIPRLQKDLAGTHVPRWMLWFSPLMMSRWQVTFRKHWRVDVPKEELERLTGMRLPKDRPNLMFYIRLIFAGI